MEVIPEEQVVINFIKQEAAKENFFLKKKP